MNVFNQAWDVVKMPYKAFACPKCNQPDLIPNISNGNQKLRNMTCKNCGYIAYPKQRKGREFYLTNKVKDEDKKRGEELTQKIIDEKNNIIGTDAGYLPNKKTEYDSIRDIYQHPLEMLLGNLGYKSISDLMRSHARLKAEKDKRFSDIIRRNRPDAEQIESEDVERRMLSFENTNNKFLLNAFLNRDRSKKEPSVEEDSSNFPPNNLDIHADSKVKEKDGIYDDKEMWRRD